MPKYYKYNIEDLKELHKAVASTEVAKWRDKHYYYTCSCCHKEELYHQSPVLSGKMWNDVCEKLGIEYPNGKIGKRHGHTLRLGNNEEFYPAIRFYDMFERIQKVESDDTYTMLCRECIEKALGRPLYQEDLDDCGQNKMHINEYKKNITMKKYLKKHYDEFVNDEKIRLIGFYDKVNKCYCTIMNTVEELGISCIKVSKNYESPQYNLLDADGNVLSKEWFELEINMKYKGGIYYGRVYKENKFNFIGKNGNLIFPNKWFTQLYNTDRAVGVDGKHYKYDLKTRTLTEIEPEHCKSGYSGGYGMHLSNGNWF